MPAQYIVVETTSGNRFELKMVDGRVVSTLDATEIDSKRTKVKQMHDCKGHGITVNDVASRTAGEEYISSLFDKLIKQSNSTKQNGHHTPEASMDGEEAKQKTQGAGGVSDELAAKLGKMNDRIVQAEQGEQFSSPEIKKSERKEEVTEELAAKLGKMNDKIVKAENGEMFESPGSKAKKQNKKKEEVSEELAAKLGRMNDRIAQAEETKGEEEDEDDEEDEKNDEEQEEAAPAAEEDKAAQAEDVETEEKEQKEDVKEEDEDEEEEEAEAEDEGKGDDENVAPAEDLPPAQEVPDPRVLKPVRDPAMVQECLDYFKSAPVMIVENICASIYAGGTVTVVADINSTAREGELVKKAGGGHFFHFPLDKVSLRDIVPWSEYFGVSSDRVVAVLALGVDCSGVSVPSVAGLETIALIEADGGGLEIMAAAAFCHSSFFSSSEIDAPKDHDGLVFCRVGKYESLEALQEEAPEFAERACEDKDQDFGAHGKAYIVLRHLEPPRLPDLPNAAQYQDRGAMMRALLDKGDATSNGGPKMAKNFGWPLWAAAIVGCLQEDVDWEEEKVHDMVCEDFDNFCEEYEISY